MEVGLLANAGLADVAFAQALMAIALAGVGTILGVAGIAYGRGQRHDCPRVAAVVLGFLGLLAVALYVGLFWSINGNGSWDQAARYPFFHALFVGVPLISSVSAMIIACLRRTPRAPKN